MSNTTKHTPTPWHPVAEDGQTITIRSRDFTSDLMGDYRGVVIAEIGERSHGGRSHASDEADANAAFILRACNAYNDLLAACEDLVSLLEAIEVETGSDQVQAARAAIAKAKGGAE